MPTCTSGNKQLCTLLYKEQIVHDNTPFPLDTGVCISEYAFKSRKEAKSDNYWKKDHLENILIIVEIGMNQSN